MEVNTELEHAPVALINEVKAFKVIDTATYMEAGELGKTLKSEIKKREEYFEPMRIKAKASYDEVLKMKKDAISPLEAVVDILRSNMNTWQRAEEMKRQEEERKAREAAEELARKEREKLLAAAIKAEEKGQTEKAESKLEQAEMVYAAPVTVAPTVAKTVATSVGNITQAKEVQVTVTDIRAFIAELVKSNPGALASIIDVRVSGLKTFVKANGLEQYPGLSIVKTTGVRF